MKNIIAADPGLSGAIVILSKDGDFIDKTPMPKIGSEINVLEIYNFLNKHKKDATMIIEDVHAIFGCSSKSTFNFGRNLGLLEAVVSCLQIPYVKIKPKEWQSFCFKGIKDIWKNGPKKRRNTKKMALIAAKRLYPFVNLMATPRSRVESDGIVDALLMAHFGRYN